jgi:trigger factor
MQINVETLSSIKKKINFEIPADRVSSEVDKAYGEIRKHAAIKGFRKGKVPNDLIKKHYSAKMADDVLKNLINETYFKALADEKIYPVSHPVIENDQLKIGEPFKYSATVEVFPDVTVNDFAGMQVKKEKYVPNEEVVEQRLKEMQENMAQLVPAEEGRAAALGDLMTFDFTGFVDGVPFEGGAAEDFQLELGSGRFIPGFEDQLVGLKAGDEGSVAVTFPENYGSKELAGKAATFTVAVKDLKIKELPTLDDEFAREFGEFETLGHLKEKLREMNEQQELARIEGEFRERVVKALIDRNDLEVPATLVEKQLEQMLDNSKKRLASQRMSLEMMGLDDAGYKAQFRSVAENKVKGSLLLEALAEQNGITVDEGIIDEKITELAEQSGQDVAMVTNFYKTNPQARGNIAAQLKEDMALEFLLSKTEILEVPREEI